MKSLMISGPEHAGHDSAFDDRVRILLPRAK
jgi:hypothetical protein